MNRWVLDTDHVSLFIRGHQRIIQKSAQKYPAVVITIITVQELFNGWIGRINQESNPENLVNLYSKLMQTLDFIKSVQVLNFDGLAKQCYLTLRQQNRVLARKRLDKDLKIASIALSQGAVMVTRNQKDFSLVPDLQLEDWTNLEETII
ncbi:MAG: type II toxin-antitoxin system VapC family toxin [Cyanobacteria bacterium P01_F01_bin.86]